MLLQNVRQSIKFYANTCLGGLALLSAAVQAAPQHDAGEVTFLLGKAFINGATPVSVGSKIGSGDVVQTLGNGHVHIRFVDDGLVSVRPESRLAIEHYEYNEAHPNESVIKFSLEEGVMRSISGNGAKAARDKFRLNTPIAAIGVRGTDFVVKSSNDLLQAVVNEGAIIVAPYSSDCQATSVGPCQSNFVELDSNAQQLLEFSSLYSAPRLLPLSAGIPSVEIDGSKIQSRPVEKSTSSTTSNNNSSASIDDNLATANTASLDNRLVSESNADTLVSTNSPLINDKVNLPEISSGSLVWGRFSSPKETDQVVYNYQTASENRLTTVSASPLISDLVLFRSPSELNKIDGSLGNVSFNLRASQATLNNNGQLSLASVSQANSRLDIDFTRRQFSTAVSVSSQTLPSVVIEGAGTINGEGFFNFVSSDTAIHGASTLEGDASSFMFYKDVGAGTSVEGVTYWYSE